MANCSSILAWEILWTEEPGGLHSMESQRIWTALSGQTTKITTKRIVLINVPLYIKYLLLY